MREKSLLQVRKLSFAPEAKAKEKERELSNDIIHLNGSGNVGKSVLCYQSEKTAKGEK